MMLVSKLHTAAFVACLTPFIAYATAQDAPCDASTQACLNVMQANTCFAAYIRGNNVTEMLRCVNVENQTLAREEVCSRPGPFENPALTSPSCVPAMDARRKAFGILLSAAIFVCDLPATGAIWRRLARHES